MANKQTPIFTTAEELAKLAGPAPSNPLVVDITTPSQSTNLQGMETQVRQKKLSDEPITLESLGRASQVSIDAGASFVGGLVNHSKRLMDEANVSNAPNQEFVSRKAEFVKQFAGHFPLDVQERYFGDDVQNWDMFNTRVAFLDNQEKAKADMADSAMARNLGMIANVAESIAVPGAVELGVTKAVAGLGAKAGGLAIGGATAAAEVGTLAGQRRLANEDLTIGETALTATLAFGLGYGFHQGNAFNDLKNFGSKARQLAARKTSTAAAAEEVAQTAVTQDVKQTAGQAVQPAVSQEVKQAAVLTDEVKARIKAAEEANPASVTKAATPPSLGDLIGDVAKATPEAIIKAADQWGGRFSTSALKAARAEIAALPFDDTASMIRAAEIEAQYETKYGLKGMQPGWLSQGTLDTAAAAQRASLMAERKAAAAGLNPEQAVELAAATSKLDVPSVTETLPSIPAAPAAQVFEAPAEITDSLMSFRQGKSKWDLNFNDPLDKALYMVAADAKQSAKAIEYIKEQFPKLTDAEIKDYAKDMRDFHVENVAREVPLAEQPLSVGRYAKTGQLEVPGLARERFDKMFSEAPAPKAVPAPIVEPSPTSIAKQTDELVEHLTTGKPKDVPNGSRLDGDPVHLDEDLAATPKGYDEASWKESWSQAEGQLDDNVMESVMASLYKSGMMIDEATPDVVRRFAAEELYARSKFLKDANENAAIKAAADEAEAAAQAKRLDDYANTRNTDNSMSPAETLDRAVVPPTVKPNFKPIRAPKLLIGVTLVGAAGAAEAASYSGASTPEAALAALAVIAGPAAVAKFRKRAFTSLNAALKNNTPVTKEMMDAAQKEVQEFSVKQADGTTVKVSASYADVVGVKSNPQAAATVQTEWDKGGYLLEGHLSPTRATPGGAVQIAGDPKKAAFSVWNFGIPAIAKRWSGIPALRDTATVFSLSPSKLMAEIGEHVAFLASGKAKNPGKGWFGTNIGAGAETGQATLDTLVAERKQFYGGKFVKDYDEAFQAYQSQVLGSKKLDLNRLKFSHKEEFDRLVSDSLRGSKSGVASVDEFADKINALKKEVWAEFQQATSGVEGAKFKKVPDSVIGKMMDYNPKDDIWQRAWDYPKLVEGFNRFGRTTVVNVIADAIGKSIDPVANKARLAAELGVDEAKLTQDQINIALRKEAVTRADRLVQNIELAETSRTTKVSQLDSDHIARTLQAKGKTQEEIDDVLGVLTIQKGGDNLPSFMRSRIKLDELHAPRKVTDQVTGEEVELSVRDLFVNSPAKLMSSWLDTVVGFTSMANVSKRIGDDLSSPHIWSKYKRQMLSEGASAEDVAMLEEHVDHLVGRGSGSLYQQHTNLSRTVTSATTLAYGEMFGMAALGDIGNMFHVGALKKVVSSFEVGQVIERIRKGEFSKQMLRDISDAFGTAHEASNPVLRDMIDTNFVGASDVTRGLDLATHFATKANGLQLVTFAVKSATQNFQMSRMLNHALDVEKLTAQDFRHMAAYGIDKAKLAKMTPMLKQYAKVDNQGVLQGFDYKGMMATHYDDFVDLRDYMHKVTRAAVLEKAGMGQIVPFMTSPVGRVVTQFMSTAMASYQRGRLNLLNMDGRIMQQWMMSFATAALAHTARAALISKSSEEFDKRTDPGIIALSAWRNSSSSLGFGGNLVALMDAALPGQGIGSYVTTTGRVSPFIPPGFQLLGDIGSSVKMVSTAALTEQDLTYSQFKHINGTFNPTLVTQLPLNWLGKGVFPESSAVNVYAEQNKQ